MDLIDRQQAIDEANAWLLECFKVQKQDRSCGLIRRLEDLQSAQKTGKWIIKDNPGTGWYRVTCSECSEDVTSTAPCIGFYPKAKVTWDFCPYCGTRMVGEEE